MDTRESRSRELIALVAMLVTALLVPALPAGADENCYYDPALGLVCEDGGEGGEPGEDPPPTEYWTSWQIVGDCGGGGAGGVFIDINTGLVMALRDRIVDGEVVETQSECIDLDEGEDEIWDELASAVAALNGPRWESNPDMNLTTGLTGLETWLWYSDPSQVGPIEAIWVEPVTGIEFGVRGRGWTESITWHTGEGNHEVFAPDWDAAPGMGGTPDNPAARFLYETSSTDAGYAAGYPVSVNLLWVGEYQVRVIDGVWTNWARFGSTLDVAASDTYEVVEVRSRLSG